jgi:mannose-6-phosphate isomerase
MFQLRVFSLKKGVMLLLETQVQQYAWGTVGSHSSVATLKRDQNGQLGLPFVLDEAKPYAELWIGTHASAPSRSKGKLLSEIIAENPAALIGKKTVEMFGSQSLPFLLKVLSVKQALSIQAHPDKALAEQLHRKFPDVYKVVSFLLFFFFFVFNFLKKDPNHKPEMTLALTPFEVLCGFRPPHEVLAHIASVPELRALLGEGVVQQAERETDGSKVLRGVFGALMTANEEAVKVQVAALVARLKAAANVDKLLQAVLRIHGDYPGDVGVFCPFILNHFWLAPGEAVFLGPNEPHAYLSGDCIECMATSDNVVRAGLTPKFRDCATLLSMLTYAVREPQALKGESVVPGVVGYYPPVPDFQVEVCKAHGELVVPPHNGACVGIVTSGNGTIAGVQVASGASIFVPCGQELHISGSITLFLASVNRSIF